MSDHDELKPLSERVRSLRIYLPTDYVITRANLDIMADEIAALESRLQAAEAQDVQYDMRQELDWNRLHGGEYRALFQEHQGVFDLFRDLQAQLAQAQSVIKNDCANEETAREMARKVLGGKVDGDTYAAVGIVEVVEMLTAQLEAARKDGEAPRLVYADAVQYAEDMGIKEPDND